MGKTVHWNICRKKDFNVSKKSFERKPLPCTKSESFKILTDFNNQTDNVTEHERPDMIILKPTRKPK